MEVEIEFKLKQEMVLALGLIAGVAIGYWMGTRAGRRQFRNVMPFKRNGGTFRSLRQRVAS